MRNTDGTSADELFRVLSDPTRRAIFERLAQGEASVSELKAGLPVSQPAVSQHLAVLRQAGLVAERQAGRHVYYRAEPGALAPLAGWVEHYQSFWRERLDQLKTLLKELDS